MELEKSYTPKMDVSNAQRLRASATDAERRIWNRVRNKQIEGLKFRRQHPVMGFILDIACEEIKLAIELDGSQHNEPEALASDVRRTQMLESGGWRVLRFWNNDVIQNIDGVMAVIREAIRERKH